MKKFWMISILLIAALFIISCGGDEEDNGTDNNGTGGNGTGDNGTGDCTDGQFRCKGSYSQTCDGGKWINFEECTDAKPCNAEGKCAPANNGGNDTGDSGDTGNGGSDTGDSGDTGNGGNDTCAEIFTCIQNNSCYIDDEACTGQCIENGSADGQNKANTMISCFLTKCGNATSQEEFNTCLNEQCANEIQECGLGGGSGGAEPADNSYANPYGSATLNFSTQYIYIDKNDSSQEGMVAIFADGAIGNNSSFKLQPDNADGGGSYAFYVAQQGILAVVQSPCYAQTQNGQQVCMPGDFRIEMQFDPNATAVGSFGIGAENQSDVFMAVWDKANPNDEEDCLHAIGVGTGNITVADNLTAGGNGSALAFTGNVTFYSPKNFKDYGDVTGRLFVDANKNPVVVPACPVK